MPRWLPAAGSLLAGLGQVRIVCTPQRSHAKWAWSNIGQFWVTLPVAARFQRAGYPRHVGNVPPQDCAWALYGRRGFRSRGSEPPRPDRMGLPSRECGGMDVSGATSIPYCADNRPGVLRQHLDELRKEQHPMKRVMAAALIVVAGTSMAYAAEDLATGLRGRRNRPGHGSIGSRSAAISPKEGSPRTWRRCSVGIGGVLYMEVDQALRRGRPISPVRCGANCSSTPARRRTAWAWKST